MFSIKDLALAIAAKDEDRVVEILDSGDVSVDEQFNGVSFFCNFKFFSAPRCILQ